MQWEFVVALVLAIPVVLFPVAFIWYLNIGGITIRIREARKQKTAHEQAKDKAVTEQQTVK